MRLDLTDDQQFFQETVRRFVETETPIATIRELHQHPDGFERSWWQRAAELGWTSFLISEDAGGGSLSGNGPADLAIVAEEMGRGVAPGPLAPVNVVAETLARVGNDPQREMLGGVMTGEHIVVWAFAERGRGWTGSGVSTAAVRDGDGFVLTGTKHAVEAGAQADSFLVTALVDGALTQFLVPSGVDGLSVTPQRTLDLGRRFAKVELDGVRVDAHSVVGAVGGAADDVERQRQMMVMLQCADTAGATAKMFETTVEYAFDRYSFGRPLASYQALKHRFADMKLWLEAMHATSDGAADALSASVDAATEVAAAKAYIGDRSVDILQDCVQLFGGMGVTWEHDIHLFLRRATVNRGLFGEPAEQRALLAAGMGF